MKRSERNKTSVHHRRRERSWGSGMDLRKMQDSPAEFRRHLLIEDGVRLGDVVEDWQRKDFESLDESWRKIAGHRVDGDPPLRSFMCRPRGHSKSTDVGVSVCWILMASLRRLRGVCAAADKEQSQILRDHIDRIVRLNPFLSQLLDVQASKVLNRHTNSQLEIITSDAPSSYGRLCDFIVADELVHWRDDSLWQSLLSTAAKRECLLLTITNAGFSDSWQASLRDHAQESPDWHFSNLDGPKASWINQQRLDEQRQLLPRIAFERLWLNRWSAGSGDALEEDDIKAAVTLDGPSEPEDGYVYFCGLDLGLKNDKSALVLLGRHVGSCEEQITEPKLTDRQKILIEAGLIDEPAPEISYLETPATNRTKVFSIDVWEPSKDRTVQIQAIEDRILQLNQRFPLILGADPWQTAFLTERLRNKGIAVWSCNFTPVNLTGMATRLLEVFGQRRIDLYPHAQLLKDLRGLRVKEMSYGVRLDSPRTLDGHGDCCTALSIGLQTAAQPLVQRHHDGAIIAC